MSKHSVSVDESIYLEIKEYCDYNTLKIGDFVSSLLVQGLAIEKYGISPFAETNSVATIMKKSPVTINNVTQVSLRLKYIAPVVTISVKEEDSKPVEAEIKEEKPVKTRKVIRLN